MLTLHGRFDPAVPTFHEERYLTKLEEAGAGEMVGAFGDLVAWLESGTTPQP